MIRANYIDCPTKAIFNTWTLPLNAEDKNGDIGWTTTVYIKDTGEIWMYGNIWGGSYSEVTDNSIVLSIGGVKYTLSLNNHTLSYTTLTGSTTIADLAILSSGVENQWVLKTLGKNAFSNEDYLLANSPAVAVENALTIKYGKSDSTLATYDGSVPIDVKLLEGDNISFILGSEGELIINALQNDDTTNTSGATNLPNTKLFIIGATELSESPQTYSNTSVYIGADNLLYSNGKEVSTSDHNHDTKYLIKSGDTMSGILSMSDDIKFIADKYIKYEDSVILGYNSDSNAIIIANSAFPTKIYSNESELIHVKNGTEYTILDVGNYINTLDTRYITLDTSQTVTGLKTFNNIILAENLYIFGGTSETNNEMLGFHLGKTIIGSIGESTIEPTHIRSKTGHITVGTGNDALYTVLDTGNYTTTLDAQYVKKNGDMMTGKLIINSSGEDNQLIINRTDGGESYFYLQSSGINKGAFTTMQSKYGTCIFDVTSARYLGIKTDGTPHFQGYTLWHEGNDGTGSGLDAGLLCSYDETKFYRSAISTVNGETALSNIPANRSGSYQLTHSGWTGAAHIFYAGGNNSTFGFMLPGGNNNTVKVISCTNSNSGEWKELGTLAYTSGNVSSADNADNADKLDGVHLNGIFTAFTASGNNTRLTIGGVTKDLTVPYASNSDKLDGYNASSFESYQVVVIDASSLDNNTWYPVTMEIGNSLQTRIRIEGNTSANASWNTRSDKRMALILDYTVNGSEWGWTSVQRVIHTYTEGAGTSNCLRGIGQLTNSSTEYVFVRGGAKYNFYVSRFITPVLRTSTYTVTSQSISPTTTMPAAITRNNALTTDNVASATRLQTARTIWGNSFDGTANVSGSLSNVTSIELYYTTPFIDFHYNNSTSDYTSRIIEDQEGILNINGTIYAKKNGNVGIGANSPSYKLQVQGKIHASDEISTAGRITSSRSGVNTVSTLASLPVTKDVVLANLSAATNLTLASTMTVGDCITIIVNPTSSFELPLPTASGWSSLDGDSILLSSGKLAEISILCYATGKYSVSCKTAS